MKKNIATLLSLLLVASCLGACGSNSNSSSDMESNSTTETVSGANETDTSPVTITAVIKDMSADDEASIKFLDEVSKGVSGELGRDVKIELAPISEGTYSDSMSLLLQSGEIPDLIYFQGGDYQFAITQGILEDLSQYNIDSTYISKLMQPYNSQRIANYPYLLWLSPDGIKVPVIRQDWLDASTSGKELVSDPTPENYKIFFTELKQQHNLNAAITIAGNMLELNTIFNLAFGIDKTWVEQDNAYVYSKVSSAQKDKLTYYAELYKEGLLDNEWISKKWDTKESAFYNGEVAVISGTSGSTINVYNSKMINQNGDSAKLAVLPPAKGVAQGYTPSDISKESRGWAINKYSENKDVAFAILEYMASPEGQILDKLGYEGEEYTIENDEYVLTDKISEWYPHFHESIATFDANISSTTPYYSQVGLDSLARTNEYSTFDNAFVLPDEYITNWDACEALCSEFEADVISGKKSIDEFDSYVEEWNSLGGQEITEYANTNIVE